MNKILFAKYNNTRVPEFQIKTVIIDNNGKRIVVKEPLDDRAIGHVKSMADKRQLIANLYENADAVSVTIDGDKAEFPYINGKTISGILDEYLDNTDELLKQIIYYVDTVLSYREEALTEFKATEKFRSIFGECDINVQGVKIANLDEIFDNIILCDEKYYIIDYEWVFDFPVPVDFIRFRTIYYYYIKQYNYLRNTIPMKDYLKYFGYDEEDTNRWLNLDDLFQQYAHGEGRKYIYTSNYTKTTHNITGILNDNRDIGQLLHEKEQMILMKDKNIADYQANEKVLNELLKQRRNPLKRVLKAILPKLVQDGLYCLYKEGLRVFCYKVKQYFNMKGQYEIWMSENERNLLYVEQLNYNPLISVIVPVYNVESGQLRECIESVINQTYGNWELVLVDDCSTMESVRTTLAEYENIDRIKVLLRSENGHISRATNSGIEIAQGDYIALLDCDDLLSPNALYEMAKKLNENKDYDFIYSDEDKITEDGKKRKDPFFKPDWSPDTFMSIMYTCHFSIFRRSLVNELGGMRVGLEGSQDYDLVLRVMEKTNRIGHVPKILYHWRERKESTANDISAKPYIIESTQKAKLDALERRGLKGRLERIDPITQFRVVYEPDTSSLVSIVIPSKDNYDILNQCITTIKQNTNTVNYEVIIVDNGSDDSNKKKIEKLCNDSACTYIYRPMQFNFSAMCNIGAAKAKGDYILFLNDDIEIRGEDWLDRLLGQAQVPYVGACGCKLLYPDSNLIQHVGVLNLEIGPGHAFHGFDDNMNYYYGRNILDYNFCVVTGACLLINKRKFDEVGGFDETLPVAYNDVELCFKLIEHGYYNVLRNDVTLIHHESISRGYDDASKEKMERQQKEMAHLYELHPGFKGYDPCYNPNLTQTRGDFSFRIDNIGKEHAVEPYDKELIEKGDIEYSLEKIYVGDYVEITGWAVAGKKGGDVKVILSNPDGSNYIIGSNSLYRPDVSNHCGSKAAAFAGFQVVANAKAIAPGRYDIYIMISGKICKTTGMIEKKDNT